MPEISRFRGIIVSIYYNDHLPPHFHAEYAGKMSRINIETLEEIEDNKPGHNPLPKRQLKIAIGWAACHQQELMENWELARQDLPLKKIAPLM